MDPVTKEEYEQVLEDRFTGPDLDRMQPPWCPELDGDTRVSSLQTAVFAGPVGSYVPGQVQTRGPWPPSG